MSVGEVIQFPTRSIYRSQDVVEALEKLALCESYDLSGGPMKVKVARGMRAFWEGELIRLDGVPANPRKHDAPATDLAAWREEFARLGVRLGIGRSDTS